MKSRPARTLLSIATALTMLMASAWVMADLAQSPNLSAPTAVAPVRTP